MGGYRRRPVPVGIRWIRTYDRGSAGALWQLVASRRSLVLAAEMEILVGGEAARRRRGMGPPMRPEYRRPRLLARYPRRAARGATRSGTDAHDAMDTGP